MNYDLCGHFLGEIIEFAFMKSLTAFSEARALRFYAPSVDPNNAH